MGNAEKCRKKGAARAPILHIATVANQRQPKIHQTKRPTNRGRDDGIGWFYRVRRPARTPARRNSATYAGPALISTSSGRDMVIEAPWITVSRCFGCCRYNLPAADDIKYLSRSLTGSRMKHKLYAIKGGLLSIATIKTL